MRHSKQEVDEAARRFEELADRMDPAGADVLRIDDLREVAIVSEAVRTDEERLRREAVAAARGFTAGPGTRLPLRWESLAKLHARGSLSLVGGRLEVPGDRKHCEARRCVRRSYRTWASPRRGAVSDGMRRAPNKNDALVAHGPIHRRT